MTNKEIQTIDITNQALEMRQAEIDSQITTAKTYPRDLQVFKADCLETIGISEDVAASCNYYLPRAGKTIEGPSIRLAEIIASNYGNLRIETEVMGHDGQYVNAQATCHDLQKNNAIRVKVRRRITNKQGKTFNDDMIQTTGMAAASIAFRNSVFKIIPQIFVNLLAEEAKKLAIPAEDKFWENVEKWFKWFDSQNISEDRVLKVLGIKSKDLITGQHITQLSGIHTSIKTGEGKIEEIFPNLLVEPQPLNNPNPEDEVSISSEETKQSDLLDEKQ